jgi:hypothetical protein
MYVLKNKSVEQLEHRIDHLKTLIIGGTDDQVDEWADQIDDIDAELARRKAAATTATTRIS